MNSWAEIPSDRANEAHPVCSLELKRQIAMAVTGLFLAFFSLVIVAHFSQIPALEGMRILNPIGGLIPVIGAAIFLFVLSARKGNVAKIFVAFTLILTLFGNLGVYQNGAMTFALGSAFLLLMSMLAVPPRFAFIAGVAAASLPVLVQWVSPLPMLESVSHRVWGTLLTLCWPFATLICERRPWDELRWLATRRMIVSGILVWTLMLVLLEQNLVVSLSMLAVGCIAWIAVSKIEHPSRALQMLLGVIPMFLFIFGLNGNDSLAVYALPMWIFLTFLLLELSLAFFIAALMLISAVLTVEVLAAPVARGLISSCIFLVMLAIWFRAFKASYANPLGSLAKSYSPGFKARRANARYALISTLSILAMINISYFIAGFSVELDSPGIRWMVLQLFAFVVLLSGLWSYFAHRDQVEFEKDALRYELEERLAELKQVNAQKDEANRKLLERQEQQAQVFSIIGHELRTPLASIGMMLESMQVSQLKPYGEQVIQAHESVMDILNDLRVVVQPDKAKEQRLTLVAPAHTVEKTLGSMAEWLQRHQFNTRLQFDSIVSKPVAINAGALRQITTNLVKNAAIHSGGSCVWVSVSGEIDGGELKLKLAVEDNGKGIAPAQREQLFEAFRRGDTSADGTGLGLYIIRELAHELDGEVSYFDSAQGGAGFLVESRLRLGQDAMPALAPVNVRENVLEGKRVLLAEDQLTLQMLTKSLLHKAGAQTEVASNGLEALEHFANQPYDIVLTDAMMPEMDGYALTRRLRETGFTGPIVAVTAAVIGDETERLIAAGVDLVLPKPLDMSRLKAELSRLDA